MSGEMMGAEEWSEKVAASMFGRRALSERVAFVRYSSFIIHHFAFNKKC
jgi:hypothetical protein